MGVQVEGIQKITFPLTVAQGGTGVTSFTTGSVIFMGATTLTEDNNTFFFDNNNKYLGINNNSPDYAIDVRDGCVCVEGTLDYSFHWRNPSEYSPEPQSAEIPTVCVGAPDYWLGVPDRWLIVHVGEPESGIETLLIPAYVIKG